MMKRRRLIVELVKEIFRRMKNVKLNNNLPLQVRLRVVDIYVIRVILYGVKTWTLTSRSVNRLQAIEMWFLRRLLRISWTEKISNVNVLKRAGVEKKYLKNIKKRRMRI